jgi:hypothetical protein
MLRRGEASSSTDPNAAGVVVDLADERPIPMISLA